MLYHVIRRPLHSNTTNSSNQSRNNQRTGSVPPSTTLMPRYHYSRIPPNSVTNNSSDSILTRNHTDGNILKPSMTATTTTTSNNNNNNHNNNQNSTSGSFKSTIIPLVTNNRTITPNKREFIQIPITREDGTSIITNNQTRSVPITFINEQNSSSPSANKNGNTSPKPSFTSKLLEKFQKKKPKEMILLKDLLRPSSKYFQYHFNNSIEEPTTTTSNLPRLPTVSRRLSLTIPITTTTNTDDDTIKQPIPPSPIRQIPIRFPQTTSTSTTAASSIPSNNSRISSAIHRTSPVSNVLQRQKTDIGDASSTPTLLTINNSQQSSSDFTGPSPIRRAEVVAREAIQGMTRFQQQQQRNNTISENNRSPPSSRRVIINLKNNQSVSLDSRLSSATKPPPIPSSSRSIQRNNLYHIPILHEIQMSSQPATTSLAESSLQSSSINNNGNYKNEFHMEIPVTITTNNNDQENQNEQNDGIIHRERISSANNNSNQTLKSILKRSSSREVSRKNVSFMNA
jgi:hypothetical protein